MKLLLLVLAVMAFTIVWSGDSEDYYLPQNDAARKTAYETCKTHAKCAPTNNDFTQAACYTFCFFDMNGDDKIVESEGLQLFKLMGEGKPVTHTKCIEEFRKATQENISDDLLGKMCLGTEHIATDKEGVVSEEDIKDFINAASANGTVDLNLDRFVLMSEVMRATGDGIALSSWRDRRIKRSI